MRLPVTGSSRSAPSLGRRRGPRTSGVPSGCSPTRPSPGRSRSGRREHASRVGQQERDPPRAVVDPLRGLDGVPRDPERRARLDDHVLLGRAGADERGRGEREPPARGGSGRARAHSYDLAAAPRRAAGLEPCVARAERRVAGERELGPRREDPDPVVSPRLRRGAGEGRLGEVGPVRDALIFIVRGCPPAVEDDRGGLPRTARQ